MDYPGETNWKAREQVPADPSPYEESLFSSNLYRDVTENSPEKDEATLGR